MQPTTQPATRLPDELGRNQLATELEQHLLALNAYCDQEPTPPLAYQLNEFIAALGEYDQATERLLSAYRRALEHAERPAPNTPTLEQALIAKMSPADLLAYREADPIYRLGFARGKYQTEQKYERLVSLYAQYAIIVPPADYKPSPVAAQAQRLIQSHLMTGPRFPLPVRKSLFFSTPSHVKP